MSKQVHCPECQSENTPGSKFCNHCGARLPKSTSVLCPRCQAPNPHNNFYCDNCGSRLHPEQNNIAPEEEEPEPEASDLPTSAKMFSLPTRQPGDTGELDPSSLPDWLNSQSEESEERENAEKLPRLSDLTPEERGKTEDLPGWLFDTESDELVISSPGDITTEHFLHLIQDIDEEEREKLSGLLNDPSIAGDSANLPDWLKEVAKPEQKDAPLAQDEISPQDRDEIPDWLGESGPPSTALLGKSDDVEPPPVEREPKSDDLPDWLTAEPDSTETQAEAQATDDIFSDDTLFEDESLDWMSGVGQHSDVGQQDESPAQEEVADDFMLDAVAATSLTGWLAEFDADDDEVEVEETATSALLSTSAPLEEAPVTDASETQRSLTDWLTAFDEEDAVPADEEPAAIEESLPDWLTGIEEEALDDPIAESAAEEVADWLDLDTSTDASLTTGETGPLPDWLDELEPATETSAQFDSSELDDTLTNLFGETSKDATGELEWLDDIDDVEPESTAPPLAPLIGAVGAAALAGAASSQDDDDAPEDDPDWLSELAAFDPNEMAEIVEEETAVPESLPEPQPDDEAEFDVDAIFAATGSAGLDSFEIDDELLGVSEQTSGDWADIDGILAGTADDEALPDWLEQLDGAIDSEIILAESGEAPPEEIPEWVASMRPDDTGEFASVLPSALFLDSDASELLSETGDLADADLPDWLDSSVEHRTATAEIFGSEDELGDAPAELEAILADLPPAQAPEDMLQKAEIPDWLEDLKPRELTGEAEPLTKSRLESSGPLAGMPNTIAIEPIIAMPRAATMLVAYTTSAEQEQQARLLRQLVQEGPQPPQTKKPAISARGVTGLRIVVAILVLAAVFLGLYGPAFLKSKAPATVPMPAVALNTAVSNAAGKTVLVAFEYSPALAGELNHEAETLLAQLNAIGSPILTTSQYVAGTAVAEAMTDPYDVTPLGLIPGEAMGLRQLGDCLGENALVSPCTSLHNLSIGDDLSNALADVSLIIVLTGERSSLINWVEQVGVISDVPIVVGVTQALEPVAVPYYASAQIDGYLNGLPATVAYQQAYIQSMTNTAAENQYGAQSLVLLVTAVTLLIGGLAFGSAKKKS